MNEVEAQGILKFSLYVHNDSEWEVCKRAFADGFKLALKIAEEELDYVPEAEQIVEKLRAMLK